MKTFFRYCILCFIISFVFLSCKEDEVITVTPAVNLSGYVQKGPFINGTTLIITELDDSLAATGKTFTTQITDNRGSFSIKTSQLDYHNLQLIATGFYFDEVKGEKSAAPLTLFALADVSEAGQINVNVLSHLEKDRVLYLINQGKSFTEAKRQAQQEILAIFGIEKEDIANAERLDISQQGEDNAILLAISAILQGNNTVAELSELLADITSDIQEDGKLDSEILKEKLKKNAISLNLGNIRQYVQQRYVELGVEAHIPAFEQYVDSDGDGILNKEEDDTPDDFVFETQQHVATNIAVTSNEINVTGIREDGFTTAVVSHGLLIKNGELLSDTLVQLKKDDKLKIQVISSSNYSTAITASLTIGTFTKSFEVITDDYTPNEFSYFNIENAIKDTDYTTSIVTITGIRHPTPVTIKNGIIIKNDVELREDSTTVVEGDQLSIKIHSHPQWANIITAYLEVGSTSKNIQVINKINKWIKKAPFPGTATYGQVSFAIGELIYVGTGVVGPNSTNEFYAYNTTTDKWTVIAGFPGSPRQSAVGFSLNGKGYVGLGHNYYGSGGGNYHKDFWEYNPAANRWTRIADLPGSGRSWASCFVINNKAYVGPGYNGSIYNSFVSDFWEYDPQKNEWKQKADYPGGGRQGAVGFSSANIGFIVTGVSGNHSSNRDVWQYNLETDQWIKKNDCAGGLNAFGMAFTINNKAYVGLGDYNHTGMDNFWEYDASTDTWLLLDGFKTKMHACGTSLQNKGYYIKGAEVWEYAP